MKFEKKYLYPTYFQKIVVFENNQKISEGIIYRENKNSFQIISNKKLKLFLKKNKLFLINQKYLNGNLLYGYTFVDRLKIYKKNGGKL